MWRKNGSKDLKDDRGGVGGGGMFEMHNIDLLFEYLVDCRIYGFKYLAGYKIVGTSVSFRNIYNSGFLSRRRRRVTRRSRRKKTKSERGSRISNSSSGILIYI